MPPNQQPWRQQDHNGDRRDGGEPAFELSVFWFVGGSSPRLMAEAVEAIGHEKNNSDKTGARNPESERHRVVDKTPIRSNGRRAPRANDMKNHRGGDNEDHNKRYDHGLFNLFEAGRRWRK